MGCALVGLLRPKSLRDVDTLYLKYFIVGVVVSGH